jgi:lipopolysaccharide transport system permease protein
MAARDLREAASLWRLCWTLAWLDIVLRYRGSMLGPFWLTLSTGLMVGSMGFIYGTLFKLNLHDYLPFLAASQVLWSFIATLVGDSCTTYTGSEGMIRSVRMPFTLYAGRILLRNLVIIAHNLVVVVVVDAVLWKWPGGHVLFVLPGVLLWLADGLAITVALGAMCARFRDIPPIIGSIMQMAFFVTPVIWKPELIGQHEWLLPFNPFFSLLEVVRGPMLGTLPGPLIYLSALLSSLALCGGAWTLFARARSRIAFWI